VNPLLEQIMETTKEEIKGIKRSIRGKNRPEDLPEIRDFTTAVSRPGQIHLIAEIKYASPSTGVLSEKRDSLKISTAYETAGAAAVSLVTEKHFFNGDIREISLLKQRMRLPVLRKDFIMDPVQLEESFLYGADAVLFIARILSPAQLRELICAANAFGLHVLVEIHDETDLEKALACGAKLIGINNRDLNTFQVDPGVTARLAPRIPSACIRVSESGFRSAQDIQRFISQDIQAVLVGTALMKSTDIFAAARSFVEAGQELPW